MQMPLIRYQLKGFLIIELLIALGLLAILSLLISKYQLQINLYQKATKEIYEAVNLAENEIEELWSTNRQSISKVKQVGKFTISITSTPMLAQTFYNVKFIVSWLSVLKNTQQINLEIVCVP